MANLNDPISIKGNLDNITEKSIESLKAVLQLVQMLELPMPDEITSGQVVRIFRSLRGWKVSDLVRESGVDRVTIRTLESDERAPQGETRENLIRVFGQGFKLALELGIKNRKHIMESTESNNNLIKP